MGREGKTVGSVLKTMWMMWKREDFGGMLLDGGWDSSRLRRAEKQKRRNAKSLYREMIKENRKK